MKSKRWKLRKRDEKRDEEWDEEMKKKKLYENV